MLEVLLGNIRSDYGESRPDRRGLPQLAAGNASSESLRAFLDIHEEISGLVDSRNFRTRYEGVASANGAYGILYYRDRIISKRVNRANKEIQFVGLPTKPSFREDSCLLTSVVTARLPMEGAEIVGRRAGMPVFRIRSAPSDQVARQMGEAFRTSSLFHGTT